MNTQQQDNKKWDEFLAKWPINKLESITLDGYTQEGNKDTFTYWGKSAIRETFDFTPLDRAA